MPNSSGSHEPQAFCMKPMSCGRPGSAARAEALPALPSRYAMCDDVAIGGPKPAAS